MRVPVAMLALPPFAMLALALCACSPAVLQIDATVVTKACSGAVPTGDQSHDPTAGVDSLRFQISGDNLVPIQVTVPFSSDTASIPNVPMGTNRRVIAEAIKGGQVRARADSGRFDATTGNVHLTLFLRVVDAFTLTGGPSGGACTRMSIARAGHAMTLLPDGRVLVTGGFSLDAARQLHYHQEAELYDPATGDFSQLAAGPALKRAGHSALAVQLGGSAAGVLLLGGEGPAADGSLVVAVKPLELFTGTSWQLVQPPVNSPPREHQAAAVDLKTGNVFIAGGTDAPDQGAGTFQTYDTASYYDPVDNVVRNLDEQLVAKVSDAVAVARANQKRGSPAVGNIVLIGGLDEAGKATAQVSAFYWKPTVNNFVLDPDWEGNALSHLPAPRVRHFAARLKDDSVLVLGGLNQATPDYGGATSAVTWLDPAGQTVSDVGQLAQARADGCGALLEDGSVLLAGGAWKDAQGTHSSRLAEVVSLESTPPARTLQGPVAGSTWGLQAARHRAACVRLLDGTVLISGGLQFPEGGGSPTILDSAEIYTPAGN